MSLPARIEASPTDASAPSSGGISHILERWQNLIGAIVGFTEGAGH
jgi:hypothetical protein